MGVLFDADGEDAGSTPWEWTTLYENGTDNVFDLSSAKANNGTYSYRRHVATAGDHLLAATAAITDSSEVFFRFYVWIPSYAQTGWSIEGIAALCDGDIYTRPLTLFIENTGDSGDPDRWYWNYGGTTGNSATNFSVDAWHCIEMHYLGVEAGKIEIWVDEDEILDTGELDLSANSIDVVGCGSMQSVSRGVTDFYYDDIKAATEYIGPVVEESGSSVPILAQYYRRLRQ